ncbi:PREDICTED: transmembrane protein 119 [Nanorana parkeri]|uniref:transmembrane protein 119 n=1 Tax=Nanorana parkeri TaxID=125878 RepID=UPI0008548C3A|nr:PREDICTED: transmembrane protein 119 [Nanorana parkeri]
MGHLLTLCMLLFLSYPASLARYTTEPEFGSGEDGTAFVSNTQSYDTVGSTTDNSVKNVNGTSTSLNVLESIKQFFKEYLLLVIVVGSLAAMLIFILCAAVIMSHRHKASAYYPSSFAPKEYVNHDDKNGGTRVFNEIPEKPHDAKVEEVLSSGNQLQADILNAAQNLKSPTKGGSIKGQKNCEGPQKTCELSQKENPQEASGDKCPESPKTQEETPGNKVQEAPAKSPEEAKPEGDIQEAPAEPKEETKPTGDSQEVLPVPAQETQPTSDSQEAAAEAKADVPSPPEEENGKEEVNPTPTECETANNNPCESKESQQAPATEPCGV